MCFFVTNPCQAHQEYRFCLPVFIAALFTTILLATNLSAEIVKLQYENELIACFERTSDAQKLLSKSGAVLDKKWLDFHDIYRPSQIHKSLVVKNSAQLGNVYSLKIEDSAKLSQPGKR